jgi:hypothetical protein
MPTRKKRLLTPYNIFVRDNNKIINGGSFSDRTREICKLWTEVKKDKHQHQLYKDKAKSYNIKNELKCKPKPKPNISLNFSQVTQVVREPVEHVNEPMIDNRNVIEEVMMVNQLDQKREIYMEKWKKREEKRVLKVMEKEPKDFKTDIQEMQCIICFENKRCMVFSCGHLNSCFTCTKELKDCPECRKNIHHKQYVFMN